MTDQPTILTFLDDVVLSFRSVLGAVRGPPERAVEYRVHLGVSVDNGSIRRKLQSGGIVRSAMTPFLNRSDKLWVLHHDF